MLISPTETTKTINKQLWANMNSFGKALDYNEEKQQPWEAQKSRMDPQKSLRSVLPASPHPIVQSSLVPSRTLVGGIFTPWGKAEQENPEGLTFTAVDVFTTAINDSVIFTNAEPSSWSSQGPNHLVSSLGQELLPRSIVSCPWQLLMLCGPCDQH